MKPLSTFIGKELVLIQPSFFKREYELKHSEEVIAKMFYPKFFSLTAVVEGFNDKYEIYRPNFWKTETAIRKQGYELALATLKSNFFRTKGTIDLQNGKLLNIKFGAFKKVCQVLSEQNEVLITFQSKLSFKDKTIITIEKDSNLLNENPWIIMLIWYFLVENKKSGAHAG